jgi:hypothetical protein
MNMKLDGAPGDALNRLQDTTLSPMEEILFKSWTKANQIKEPDAPGDIVDYRGIYKHTNGTIMPYGQLKLLSEKKNNEHKLEQALRQQMLDRIDEVAGKEEDFANQMHKEERQDITHKQKMDQEGMKLKRAPFDVQIKENDLKGKQIGAEVKRMDVEKQRLGLDAGNIANEGKKLDLIANMLAPKPVTMGMGNATTEKKPGGNPAPRNS